MMKKVCLRIPDELEKELEATWLDLKQLGVTLEQFSGTTKTHIINMAIKKYLQEIKENREDIVKLVKLLGL